MKRKATKSIQVKRRIYYVLIGVVSAFLLFFVGSFFVIGQSAKTKCEEAQMRYKGDCVESLMQVLKDEKNGFRERNSAIWALGQYGDSRALPVLRKFYTGNIPDREPLDKGISQYELKKAINLASGGINIGAFIWRGSF